MALGGVDWRMSQTQAGTPDWRQIMQAAVFGGMPMGGGSNAPFDPAALPGMIDQIAGSKPKPKQAPAKPAPAATMQPTPHTPVKNAAGIIIGGKRPDGTMYDIYGNQWDASGNMLGPPGA